MRSRGNVDGRNRPAGDSQAEKSERDAGRGPYRLAVIGLGPGRESGLTQEARDALAESEVIFGYKLYVDQVRGLIADKDIRSSGMTRELDRAGQAIDLALTGVRVAVVSGGDPGVYAMAGVVFELARARNIELGESPGRLFIRVVPGIPALAAAAARLGAPLMHDFAAISLSDRMTPWELISKRLDLAAEADFVIVIYNPKSKGRDWQFAEAMKIIGRHRRQDTPVGLVTKAMREGESVLVTVLSEAAVTPVDMQTVVTVGNSRSYIYQGRMVTPRGYLDKYPNAQSPEAADAG